MVPQFVVDVPIFWGDGGVGMNSSSFVSGRSLMLLCEAEVAPLSEGSFSLLILCLGHCAAAIPRIQTRCHLYSVNAVETVLVTNTNKHLLLQLLLHFKKSKVVSVCSDCLCLNKLLRFDLAQRDY